MRHALAALLAAACTVPLPPELLARDAALSDQGPNEAFDQAARVTGVPAELLMAVSSVETRFQMVQGEAEFPDQSPAWGLMGLREDRLEAAAALAELDPDAVRSERDANVMATAMLLASWGDEAGIRFDDLAAWAPIVAQYSGIDDEQGAAEYVHFDVYGTLARGIELEGLVVAPRVVTPDFPLPARVRSARLDDGSAIWTPSPNYNSRSGDAEYVVIHPCEGAYSGCWSWLANSASGVSAHYVVNESGSEVRQLVDEDNRAWHASANYDCDLNSGKDCSNNGTSMNTLAIGIEHAGYSSQSSWNTGLLQRSAELTCGITQRHGIPIDSYHIVGHGQIQPYNRTDPGPNWPWADYLDRVATACGNPTASPSGSSAPSTTSPTGLPLQFVVDSNNSANTSRTYVEVDSRFWASANVQGYWNTGYWVSDTSSSGGAVDFWFDADATACWAMDAWWTAAGDRASNATFVATDATGKVVGRRTVDQQLVETKAVASAARNSLLAFKIL